MTGPATIACVAVHRRHRRPPPGGLVPPPAAGEQGETGIEEMLRAGMLTVGPDIGAGEADDLLRLIGDRESPPAA